MELWESTFLLFKPTVCSILYGSPRTLIHILSQNDILKWQFLYLWEERTLAFGEFGVSVLMTTRYMMWTLLGAHTLLLSWLFFFFFFKWFLLLLLSSSHFHLSLNLISIPFSTWFFFLSLECLICFPSSLLPPPLTLLRRLFSHGCTEKMWIEPSSSPLPWQEEINGW